MGDHEMDDHETGDHEMGDHEMSIHEVHLTLTFAFSKSVWNFRYLFNSNSSFVKNLANSAVDDSRLSIIGKIASNIPNSPNSLRISQRVRHHSSRLLFGSVHIFSVLGPPWRDLHCEDNIHRHRDRRDSWLWELDRIGQMLNRLSQMTVLYDGWISY